MRDQNLVHHFLPSSIATTCSNQKNCLSIISPLERGRGEASCTYMFRRIGHYPASTKDCKSKSPPFRIFSKISRVIFIDQPLNSCWKFKFELITMESLSSKSSRLGFFNDAHFFLSRDTTILAAMQFFLSPEKFHFSEFGHWEKKSLESWFQTFQKFDKKKHS